MTCELHLTKQFGIANQQTRVKQTQEKRKDRQTNKDEQETLIKRKRKISEKIKNEMLKLNKLL